MLFFTLLGLYHQCLISWSRQNVSIRGRSFSLPGNLEEVVNGPIGHFPIRQTQSYTKGVEKAPSLRSIEWESLSELSEFSDSRLPSLNDLSSQAPYPKKLPRAELFVEQVTAILSRWAPARNAANIGVSPPTTCQQTDE
jgi:hypothetical protein